MTTETMTSRSITIHVSMSPAPCLSSNNRSRRGGAHEREAATRELREAAYYGGRTWTGSGPRYLDFGQVVDVHEHIIWPKGQRLFDPDGLASMCKAALDGIVDAGLIAGDSAKHVRTVSVSQEKGTEAQGMTIITISEVDAT